MKIPNADKAVITEDKLRNYLLNLANRKGGSKAKLLLSLGYRAEDWPKLAADIRSEHLRSKLISKQIRNTASAMNLSPHYMDQRGRPLYFEVVGKSTLERIILE